MVPGCRTGVIFTERAGGGGLVDFTAEGRPCSINKGGIEKAPAKPYQTRGASAINPKQAEIEYSLRAARLEQQQLAKQARPGKGEIFNRTAPPGQMSSKNDIPSRLEHDSFWRDYGYAALTR